jgi:hypothetical protein
VAEFAVLSMSVRGLAYFLGFLQEPPLNHVGYPYTSSEADQPSKRAAKNPFQASTMLSAVYDTVRGLLRVVPGTSDAQRASLVEVNST